MQLARHTNMLPILLGDLNARVGARTPTDSCIGQHHYGTRNSRGQAVVNMCHTLGVRIWNTYFKKQPSHQWTWRHPAGTRFHQIDYIVAPARLHVRNVDVLNRFDFSSDHRLLRADVQLHHRWFKVAVPRQPEYDTDWNAFRHAISSQHSQWRFSAVTEQYNTLANRLRDAQDFATIPRSRSSYISDDTLDLFRRRSQLQGNANQHVQFVAISKELRQSLKDDLRKHHEAVISRAIDKGCAVRHAEQHHRRQLILGLRNNTGSIVRDQSSINQVIKRFYTDLYHCPNDDL